MKINTKTIARIAATQVLFQYHEAPTKAPELLVEEIISFYKNTKSVFEFGILEETEVKIKPSKSHLENLVKFTIDNLSEIDEIISSHLTGNWTIKTLPVLLLSLMRVAICELKFFPETPKKVVINEFTDIANDMLSSSDVPFVNSSLDTISKEI